VAEAMVFESVDVRAVGNLHRAGSPPASAREFFFFFWVGPSGKGDGFVAGAFGTQLTAAWSAGELVPGR